MSPLPRATGARRGRRRAVQLLVGVMITLGLVASVLLVFTEEIRYIRVGLVAALWAATVGAFGMTKYRRALGVEGAKVRDLQTVYQLQLEREVAARREYELGVESRVRRDLQVDVADLAGLRAELAELRKNLEQLLDGELPPTRPALRAEATRVAELPGAITSFDPGLTAVRYAAAGQPPPPLFTAGSGAAFANPFDEPVTAETSAVPSEPHLDQRYYSEQQFAEQFTAWSAANTELGQWPEAPESDWADPGEIPAAEPHAENHWDESQWDDAEPDGSHTSGLSVAQIMANLRSEGHRLPLGTPHHRDGAGMP